METFAFQQATIDAIMEHYTKHDRALCADEAGMGKTFIAKGVIARLADQYALEQIKTDGKKGELQEWWEAFCDINARCVSPLCSVNKPTIGGKGREKSNAVIGLIRKLKGSPDWDLERSQGKNAPQKRAELLKNALDLSKADDDTCLKFVQGMSDLLFMKNGTGRQTDWDFIDPGMDPGMKQLTDIIVPFYALYICCNLDIAEQNTEKLSDLYQAYLADSKTLCDRLSVLWHIMERPMPYLNIYPITSTVSTRKTPGKADEFELLRELQAFEKPANCNGCNKKGCKEDERCEHATDLQRIGEKKSLDLLKQSLNLIIFDEFQNFGDIITMMAKSDDEQEKLIGKIKEDQDKESNDEKKAVLKSRFESLVRIRNLVNALYCSDTEPRRFPKTLFLSATPFHDPGETDEDAYRRIGFDDLLGVLGVSESDIGKYHTIIDVKGQQDFLYKTAGIFRTERRMLLGKLKNRNIDEQMVPCDCTGILSQALYFKSGGQGSVVVPALLSTPDLCEWYKDYAIERKHDIPDIPKSTVEFGRYQKLREIVCAPSANQNNEDQNDLTALLWIPPVKPSKQLDGIFAKYASFSKSLVFSRLMVTPQALCQRLNEEFAAGEKSDADQESKGKIINYLKDLLKDAGLSEVSSEKLMDMLLSHGTAAFGKKTDCDKFKEYCEAGCLADVLREFREIHGANAAQKLNEYCKLADGRFARRMTSIPKNDALEPSEMQRVFNTPFRPFVAISTSIGAEGLDFHFYCNRLVHYTLPPNAVKFEQMNGRIDRMNSLAVRRWWSKHPCSDEDRKLLENQTGGLSPLWDYGCKELHYYKLFLKGTDEQEKWERLLREREAFRKKLGTWQDDIEGAVNLCPYLRRNNLHSRLNYNVEVLSILEK